METYNNLSIVIVLGILFFIIMINFAMKFLSKKERSKLKEFGGSGVVGSKNENGYNLNQK